MFSVFSTIIIIMIMIRKAFKFRLDPTTEQAQQMVEFAGANRFVWNKALALNLSRLENKQALRSVLRIYLNHLATQPGLLVLKHLHEHTPALIQDRSV